MQGYSKMVAPMTNLLRETTAWEWTPECQDAFDAVKHALTHAPVLALPDFSKPMEVVTDASGSAKRGALGAVLLQDGRVIAYESRTMNDAELNYTTTEQECLAAVHALKVWRCYLEGVHFKLVTDHCPNTHLATQPMLNRRQARWSEFLQQYNFEWVYRPGRANVADPLSRIPEASISSLIVAALGRASRTSRADSPEIAKTPATLSSFTPLVSQLVAGYQNDVWFQNAENTDALRCEQGIWYKDSLMVVPDVSEPETGNYALTCTPLCTQVTSV